MFKAVSRDFELHQSLYKSSPSGIIKSTYFSMAHRNEIRTLMKRGKKENTTMVKIFSKYKIKSFWVVGFLLLQADLDRHPGKSICLHKDQVYFTFKKSSAFTRGGMLVWIRHVASRCYASFPKQPCQRIAILSYDIHYGSRLGPFLGHRLICWFSQNGDDILVMHIKT